LGLPTGGLTGATGLPIGGGGLPGGGGGGMGGLGGAFGGHLVFGPNAPPASRHEQQSG